MCAIHSARVRAHLPNLMESSPVNNCHSGQRAPLCGNAPGPPLRQRRRRRFLREIDGFQELPSRDEWCTPRPRNEAHIRRLGAHLDMSSRVIAGVEVGGVHVSEDRGETWTERRDRVHDDRLYAAAACSSPGSWDGESGADGALFVSENGGEIFVSVSYPGAPQEVILALASADSHLVAGANEGRVIVERGEDWETAGTVPAGFGRSVGRDLALRPRDARPVRPL